MSLNENSTYTLPDGTDIRALPKVSLHDHLDGGLRPATVLELADGIGLQLPADDPVALGAWFAQKSNSGSLVEYLKTFDLTTAVMQTREGLSRVAREFVQDLGADGVVYGEIRWAPEQHLTRGLTLDETVEAVQEGIDEIDQLFELHLGPPQQVSTFRARIRFVDAFDRCARSSERALQFVRDQCEPEVTGLILPSQSTPDAQLRQRRGQD